MHIASKELSPLHLEVDLTIEPSDYKADFEKSIKEMKNTAQMKGFRKGTVPQHIIMKFYGKEKIYNTIQDKIQKGIQSFFEEQNISLLADLLPLHDDEKEKITTDTSKTYHFKFELGQKPKVNVKGISSTDSYTQYKVQVAESKVDDAITNLLKRQGSNEEVDDKAIPGDLIYVDAKELVEGEIKENGIQKIIILSFDDIVDTTLQDTLKQSKKGDAITFDIYKSEDKPREFINKHLLGQEDDEEHGPMFQGPIVKVMRLTPATLDEDFIKKLELPQITDEDSLREDIRKQFSQMNDKDAVDILNTEIYFTINHDTEVPLPEEFLRKAINFQLTKSETPITDDDFKSYVRALKWELIRNELMAKYDVKVTREEIKFEFIKKIYGYFGGSQQLGYDFMDNMAENLMKDKKQVDQTADELIGNKLFGKIREDITIIEEPISEEAFSEKAKEVTEKIKELNG